MEDTIYFLVKWVIKNHHTFLNCKKILLCFSFLILSGVTEIYLRSVYFSGRRHQIIILDFNTPMLYAYFIWCCRYIYVQHTSAQRHQMHVFRNIGMQFDTFTQLIFHNHSYYISSQIVSSPGEINWILFNSQQCI